jgi:hypothetical protein
MYILKNSYKNEKINMEEIEFVGKQMYLNNYTNADIKFVSLKK